MPIDAETRRLTFAIFRGMPEAADALATSGELAAIEALASAASDPPKAEVGVRAMNALIGRSGILVEQVLRRALASPYAPVRALAAEAAANRGDLSTLPRLARIVEADSSWTTRRTALGSLVRILPGLEWLPWAASAATDPHWRVRNALLSWIQSRAYDDASRDEALRRLGEWPAHPRKAGVLAELGFRWGRINSSEAPPNEDPPMSWCPFWDDDPAVLARAIDRLGERGLREHLAILPRLLGHVEEGVRRWPAKCLRDRGSVAQLEQALPWIDNPRHDAFATVRTLFDALEFDRAEPLARGVLNAVDPPPHRLAWALDHCGPQLPVDDLPEVVRGWLNNLRSQAWRVRIALAGVAGRFAHAPALMALVDDPDPEVRLAALRSAVEAHVHLPQEALDACVEDDDPAIRGVVAVLMGRAGSCLDRFANDPHPLVRAASLDSESARRIVQQPEDEPSWVVLAAASRLARVPFRRLEPVPAWEPPPLSVSTVPMRQVSVPQLVAHRRVGRTGPDVTPLGLSGHYGLPEEGYARAIEAGVNLFFWEPNYGAMTRFFGGIGPDSRRALHVIAGTFEAEPARIEKDAERVLRHLRLERLPIFLLFWTRSWTRIDDEVHRALARLRASGKVGMTGLSTHDRTLAAEALREGWDPVMVRHNLAHRKAESQVFRIADELESRVITFSSTCYGRLLGPGEDGLDVTAADCCRYSMSQSGVAAVLTAPATLDQLDANLMALTRPEIDAERLERLIRRGDILYRRERAFRDHVRSR